MYVCVMYGLCLVVTVTRSETVNEQQYNTVNEQQCPTVDDNQCTKEIQNVVAYTEEPVWGFVVDMPVYRTKAGQINIGTTVQKVPELLESGIDEKRCSKLNKCKPEFFKAYHIAPTNCKVGNEVRVARNCAPRSRRSATPSTRRSRMLGTTSSLLVSAFLLLPLLLLFPPPPALRQTSPPLLSTTLSPTTLPPTTPLFQRLKRRNHGQSCVCTSSSSSLHPQPAKIKFRRVGLVPWISFKLHLKIFQFLFPVCWYEMVCVIRWLQLV